MHCLVDISSHGFGHLAQLAPVLDCWAERTPGLRLTIRCGLPAAHLRQLIETPFAHLAEASDFGYVMHDATRVDLAASAAAYRRAHAQWPQRVAAEARLQQELGVNAVLCDVSYLPLAGAEAAGLPAVALSSLNWAGLFAHFFADADWAPPILAEMLAAYRSALFLRCEPAMAMPELVRQRTIGTIARRGRRAVRGDGETRVLVSMGGIAMRLPLEDWPRLPGVRWLVPAAWQCRHPDAIAYEPAAAGFTDLLCSVDAVLGKPGYGLFTEAACNGVPLLYVRRDDWPEQDCLIEWLQAHGRCAEVAAADLAAGRLGAALAGLLAQAPRDPVEPAGIVQAVDCLRAAFAA